MLKSFVSLLAGIVFVAPVSACASNSAPFRAAAPPEKWAANSLPSDSRFAPIADDSAGQSCTVFLPPQLLRSHSGSPALINARQTVKVDLVIGKDGEVQDAIVVGASAAAGEPEIGAQISSWEFKPALCDGAPVEAEGRIEVPAR